MILATISMAKINYSSDQNILTLFVSVEGSDSLVGSMEALWELQMADQESVNRRKYKASSALQKSYEKFALNVRH